MPSVTIDAGVLAVPPLTGGSKSAHDYVDTILDWGKLLDTPWIAIYMSERAAESLTNDNLLPLRTQLKDLFSANGIIEYDVNTVASVIDKLLSITPYFETYFKVSD